ncbi:MAG: hypothetical protein JXA11_00330 [Phycisphaerae bacterium]|nr:hypothetical protein [Phycisphaerae bacterium]
MKYPLTLLPLLLSFGGCGLLHLPTSQTYPGPVKMICVFDAKTKKSVSDVNVEFDVDKYENWFRMPVQLYTAENLNDPLLRESGTVDSNSLVVTKRESGTFIFEEKTFLGSKMIWFPLPPVLGNELYKEHRAFIHIHSTGYIPLCFDYCTEVPPVPGERYETRNQISGWATFHKNGTLNVYLSPGRSRDAP